MSKRPAELDDADRRPFNLGYVAGDVTLGLGPNTEKNYIKFSLPAKDFQFKIGGHFGTLQPDKCAHDFLDKDRMCVMCGLRFPPD